MLRRVGVVDVRHRARLAAAVAGAKAVRSFGILEGAPLLAAYGIDTVPARLLVMCLAGAAGRP